MAIGDAGANFVETTDPSSINMNGPYDLYGNPLGEGSVGPITFGVDATGLPQNVPLSYVLRVGTAEFTSTTPAIRATPAELLTAAGQPLMSATDRDVAVSVEIREGAHVLARTGETLTFGPYDGAHAMAPAPVVAPVNSAGAPVRVHYDLTGITGLNNPELIISSVDHWSPFAAPLFRVAYSAPLPATSGTITVPASVFAAGGGVYGAAVMQNPDILAVGAVTPFRIAGGSADQRPDAPTLAPATGSFGHQATITRAAPALRVHWDAREVRGATGAALEVSAPGPTVYGSANTFTNQFGTTRDANGVDSPSKAWIPLPGVAGTTTLDPIKLGIPTSLNYAVRVVATSHGRALGQASPVSALEIDDGVTPDGGLVTDFDINPGGSSTVATATVNPDGSPSGSSIASYDPGAGSYGPAYAKDPSGNGAYFIYGSDPGAHRLLAASYPWSGTEQHLLTYDTTDRHQVADRSLDAASEDDVLTARVDPQRHRADLLAWRAGDQADVVMPLDTTTGTLGAPVDVDNGTPGGHFYTMLDVQQATGKVDLAGSPGSDICVIRRGGFTTADLDAGTAAPMSPTYRCLTGVTSDQAGHANVTIGPLFSFPLRPVARMQQVNESDGTVGDVQDLGGRSPLFPVVDTVHGLLIVGFLVGNDYQVNNNAMSGVGVYDLHSGTRLSFSEDFNLFSLGSSMAGVFGTVEGERGIQLDPATRTAWTYSPYGDEIQQFSY